MNKHISLLAVAGLMSAMASAQQAVVRSYLADKAIRIESMRVAQSGDQLLVNMELNMDSLQLSANDRYVFTPLVVGRSNNVELPAIVLNGRKQDITYRRNGYRKYGPEAVSVRRKNKTAQTVHYSAAVPYESWMENVNVEVIEDYCGCGDVLNQNVALVHRLRTPYMPYLRPQAEAQKERFEEGRAFVDFPVDKITLYPDYRENPRELNKIIQTINLVKEDKNTTITGISIHGFASPESPYEHNAYLAENRARTLKDYVRKLLHLEDRIFSVEFTPEDWDGLRKYVAESALEHKTEILALIDDTKLNPDAKEWKIKSTYPEDYRFMLNTWYPALRHSDYVVTYRVRPFSVEEAKEILKTKPQQLSLEEMFLVAQTYEAGSPEFNDVMETAARMFPNDETANINAACARMEVGDLKGARLYLDKTGDSPDALHAKGVLELLEGDSNKASELFNKAKSSGSPKNIDKNIQTLDLQ